MTFSIDNLIIKPVPLKEILGIELDYIPIEGLEELTSEEARERSKLIMNSNLPKNQWPSKKDYHECHQMYFLEEDKYKQLIEHEKDNLKRIFKDQIVVDLGCSMNPYGYFLALHGEAKSYIGVDITMHINNMLNLKISENWDELHENKKPIPLGVVQKEMLSFLDASHRAKKKYSFITSGYGNYPKDESLFSNKFFEILHDYLPKCTYPNGGILQSNTSLKLEGYTQLDNKHHETNPSYSFKIKTKSSN